MLICAIYAQGIYAIGIYAIGIYAIGIYAQGSLSIAISTETKNRVFGPRQNKLAEAPLASQFQRQKYVIPLGFYIRLSR